MESKKSEIITAISNLIDKALKWKSTNYTKPL
jgi:hypothetical protein